MKKICAKLLSAIFCFAFIAKGYAQYQRIGIRAGEKCIIPVGKASGKINAYCLDHLFEAPNPYVPYSIVNDASALQVVVGATGKSISLVEAKSKGLVDWVVDYDYEKDLVDFKFIKGKKAGNNPIVITSKKATWFDCPINEELNEIGVEGGLSPPTIEGLHIPAVDYKKTLNDIEILTGRKTTAISTREQAREVIWGLEEVADIQEKLTERGYYHGPKETDVKAVKLAMSDFNKSIGLNENSTFDRDIFKVVKYLPLNEPGKKYIYITTTIDRLLIGYDKLYEIPINNGTSKEDLERVIGNIIKVEDDNLVLVEDPTFYRININELSTGLSERYPTKAFYTMSSNEKDFKIFNTTIEDGDVSLCYYKPVTGTIGPSDQRLQQYTANGLNVNRIDNLSNMPLDERQIKITLGDNDSFRNYYKYLEELDGWLKDKTLISVACYSQSDNNFYYRLKRRHGIRHIVHFSTLIDPIAADMFILKMSQLLREKSISKHGLKQLMDKVANELINENPGNPKYQALKKYLISLIIKNNYKQFKYYNYDDTKTVFYC